MTPDDVLRAYRQGYFPMAEARHHTGFDWYEARRRGIIPLEAFHLPRRARRHLRQAGFRYAINGDFAGVIGGCADRESTWIGVGIEALFLKLHEAGHAHSFEAWDGETLVAGLYGLAFGRVFCAESIFQRRPEAMKGVLAFCHAELVRRGYRLWDTQFLNPFLEQFGAMEIPAKAYQLRLAEATAADPIEPLTRNPMLSDWTP